MRLPTLKFVSLAVCLSLVGASATTASADSVTDAEDAVRAKYGDICKRQKVEVEKLTAPKGSSLKPWAKYLSKLLKIGRKYEDEARAVSLDGTSDPFRSRVDEIFKIGDEAETVWRKMIKAVRRNKKRTFAQLFESLETLSNQQSNEFEALKIGDCTASGS